MGHSVPKRRKVMRNNLDDYNFARDSRNCEAATLPYVDAEEGDAPPVVRGRVRWQDEETGTVRGTWLGEEGLRWTVLDAVANGEYVPEDSNGVAFDPETATLEDLITLLPEVLAEQCSWLERLEINGQLSSVHNFRANFLDAQEKRMLPYKWGVCPVCNGSGSHVNPAIDCSGLSAADFEENPDFEREYRKGEYDMKCNFCRGRTTVPVPDFSKISEGDKALWKAQQRRVYDDRQEWLAEIKMGA